MRDNKFMLKTKTPNPYMKREIKNLRKKRKGISCSYCNKSVIDKRTGKIRLGVTQFGEDENKEILSFCNDGCLERFEKWGVLK